MSESARLRFKSTDSPKEHGALLLNEDGTIEIIASAALRDEMARLEEAAIVRSRRLGYGIGLTLIVLGGGSIFLGWLMGRIFGKLGQNLSNPRPLEMVQIGRTEGGGVRVSFPGLPGAPQTIDMSWNADEIRPDDIEPFFNALNEMQGTPLE